jgi:pSer/pThr/pTyr-binding forkhead associated (FHA) protein
MAPPKRTPTPQEERYEEADILRADDPRPQRVPQYPPGTRRNQPQRKPEEHIPTTIYDTEKSSDQELRPNYDPTAISDGGFKPAFLYVERGPGQGQLVQVLQGPLVVGRATVSDLRLQHPSVSRRHSQITRVGEAFYVKDLSSQNGTFVNKQRIATEVEIYPGDELAIGNALVKLRGPLQPGQAPVPPPSMKASTTSKIKSKAATTAIVRKVRRPNAVRLAFFAGAVGFGLAAMFGLAVWKMPTGVSFNPLPADRALTAADKEKQIQDAIERKMAEKTGAEDSVRLDVDPVPYDASREKRSGSSTRSGTPSKGADPFADAPGSKKTGTEPAKKAGLPAPYLSGDAAAAVTEAQKSGDAQLTQKLQKFLETYEAAQAAVVANNGNQAIKGFEAALRLDAGLSGGKGKYAGELHRQLSSLYALVGFHYLSTNAADNAKVAFKASLKHDPKNEKAQEQLTKLEQPSGFAAASAAADGKAVKTPAAPLRRPGAKTNDTTTKKQAIDDAFGD